MKSKTVKSRKRPRTTSLPDDRKFPDIQQRMRSLEAVGLGATGHMFLSSDSDDSDLFDLENPAKKIALSNSRRCAYDHYVTENPTPT